MSDTAYKVTATREQFRIWSNVITRHDKDRDQRDSVKAMKVDGLIAEHSGRYFSRLDELVEEAGRWNRRFPTQKQKDDSQEYQDKLAELNKEIEELDADLGQQSISILFTDSAPFNYSKDYFLGYKGFPADRKNGPKWQGLKEALESVEKVEVQEKPRDTSPVPMRTKNRK